MTADGPQGVPGEGSGSLGDLARRLEAWRARVLRPFTERRATRRETFTTDSRLVIHDLYTPVDGAGRDYVRDLGFPGEPPFTRGIYPTMYRGRLWTMRQYAGYASAEESNARYRYLLSQGQTGLSVAFDLPTQIGYDPDHPLASGEVGRVGVSIASLADMEQLFSGIPLDQVSTSMTINATAPILLALYVAVARRQGVEERKLRGTIQNDILKEYVARGTYIFPPAPSLRLVTDVIDYASRQVPRWHAISVSGYHMREAGATAAQEIAFTLANAVQYVNDAIARGLEPDAFLPRLSFFFASQNNLLEEVAKFRAARRLWARIVSERFRAQDERSQMMRFHTQTAGVALTAQQPMNNAVRVTVQALAAVLGGTQSLHTNAMDEALGLPTEASVTLALRTQQILAYESGVADVVDPLAGSYYVEALTDELEAQSRELIEQIDDMGGALVAVESGWMAGRIADSAYQAQRDLEAGARTTVGVNRFVEEDFEEADVLRIDPDLERQRRQQLARLRDERDGGAVAAALDRLREAAVADENLMPLLVDAVEAYATVGEICDVLRDRFGEHRGLDVV
jgi:methylmalonyl-CoA mutase N-terminal domain/subunit